MDNEPLRRYAEKIERFYMSSKRMPSYSEMLKLFGVRSKNAVFKKVRAMIDQGILEKDQKGKLVPLAVARPLRLLGLVRAGFPSPAEEELQDIMSLDEYLISNPQATFLLKVEGDSMVDAGIQPGDLVLIQKNLAPKPGDIVVARVDNEWTLKYFDKAKGNVVLRAGNKKYPEIMPRQELVIAGVVIANVRKYR